MPPKLLVVHDEPGVRQLITNTIGEHGMTAAPAKFPLDIPGEIRAHKPTHVIIDWQLTDHVTFDLSRIRWPNEAMRRYVMEGRSEQQALKFMRDADPSEPNARQLLQLATQAEVKMPVTGLSVAREVLERHPKVKVAIYSYAMEEDLLKSPQYRELHDRFPDRLTNITAHQDGLKIYLEALKNRRAVNVKAMRAPEVNISSRKFFNETRRKVNRLYAQQPYDLDELLDGKPDAVAKYKRIKKKILHFTLGRIASATTGTPRQKKELKRLLLQVYERQDLSKNAISAATRIYGSPQRAIKQLTPAVRTLSAQDSEVAKFLQQPEIFNRPDHNLFVLLPAQMGTVEYLIHALKSIAQKRANAA
ncbi:MAG: hypothetical protein V1787_03510 [Candidatus Micrarchaeota archaeon]